MDSRGNNAHHRYSRASTAAPSMSLDAFSPRTHDAGVQGLRIPRWPPLVLGPWCLLLSALFSVVEDQPLLWRKWVRTLSGGLSLLFCREPADWCHRCETEQWRR